MSVRLRRWCQRKSATSLTLPFRCMVQPVYPVDAAGNHVYRHASRDLLMARRGHHMVVGRAELQKYDLW